MWSFVYRKMLCMEFQEACCKKFALVAHSINCIDAYLLKVNMLIFLDPTDLFLLIQGVEDYLSWISTC